jgi:hypothetical protein
VLSFLMAKRPIMNGGLTGLRCQSIVSEIRKSGPVVFSRFQEMWGSAVFTSDPENLDQLYFQVPRKFGELYLYVVQKIWTNCIFTYPRYLDLGEWCLHVVQKIWTSCIFTFPGNLGSCIYTWSRKSGPIVFSRTQDIWIWGSGVYTWSRKSGPTVFSRSQEIWAVGVYTWSRKSGSVVLSRTQEIWAVGVCTWSRNSGPVVF